MSKLNLNSIPEIIEAGTLSKKAALNKLSVFLLNEGHVFGLHKYDDDFKSEIIVALLEKGIEIFDSFNAKYGSFSTYFFCLVKGLVQTNLKNHSRKSCQENVFFTECAMEYSEKEKAYGAIIHNDLEKPKIPYSYKKIDSKALEIACKSGTYHIKKYIEDDKKDGNREVLRKNLKRIPSSTADKIILVLALKYSYYLTTHQIETICEMFNIDKTILYDLIQQLKNNLESRENKKDKIEEKRNAAYFFHKRYKQQKIKLEEAEGINLNYTKMILEKKYKNQTKNWERLNKILQKGVVKLRPTNKAIAEVLGLCERQISHYLLQARKLGLNVL